VRLLAEAFGPKVWERAVVVFTFAGSPLPAGQDFPGHLENRLRVLQWEIAQHADGATARAIPGVAVENRPPRKLPDGSEWLGELWVRVLERLSPMAGLSYFLATAERVREGQIPLSPEQQARTKRVIDDRFQRGRDHRVHLLAGGPWWPRLRRPRGRRAAREGADGGRKALVQQVRVDVELADGAAKIKELKLTGSKDIEASVEGYAVLQEDPRRTTVRVYVKFKFSDAFFQRNPKFNIIQNDASLARAKRPDGFYGFLIEGPIAEPARLQRTPMPQPPPNLTPPKGGAPPPAAGPTRPPPPPGVRRPPGLGEIERRLGK
jgi:hypothetical protein